MKSLKKILAATFSMLFLFSFAACGNKGVSSSSGNQGENSSSSAEEGGGTVKSGTIDIFLPIDADSETALKNVGNSYAKMMKGKGVNVRINVRSSQDPQGYITSVDGLLKYPDKQAGDIIQANTVAQYYGTGKLVDFTPYLNSKNPYNENKVWKTTLREDAYRTDDKTQEIYNLSMEGNALVAFYNKKIFAQYDVEVPSDWNSLISALDTLKLAGYTAPLGLNYDAGGLDSNNFNWVQQMYMDQYFRDMIDDAHSQSSDYSYISEIDDVWEYDAADPLNDSRKGYSYNFTRVVNSYFKDGSKYNTKSARYAEMMKNMKKLVSYSSSDYSNSVVRQRFQQDALAAEGKNYELKSRVAVYLLRLDYITDHQKSLGQALGKANGILPISELSQMLGWFPLPAMPNNGGAGAPAADNVRTLGGPDHHPFALVNRDADKTALCMDFLKYLFSPTGFDEYYKHYKNLGKVCAMQCYLKDYTLPAEVSIAGKLNFDGDCSTNPYRLFANWYTENTGIMAPSGKVQTLVNSQIADYLRADGDGSDWASYGANIYNIMADGFSNYASWRKLKWNDLAAYTSANVNYSTDPMN
ncbi:MAG: extracellular solute-binding protein [Christensenellaceae bacterium]|jgi:extracellular solute-binding protein family 1